MQKANEIREHIAAIQQIQKITGAMEMISSNRMRQVMSHIEYNRQYYTYIRRAMKELLISSKGVSHPYLTIRKNPKRTYVVLSSDKGFCGAHNSTVLNYALRRIKSDPEASLIAVGRTAEPFFHTHNIAPSACYDGIAQDPTLYRAREAATELTDLYESGESNEIIIIYMSFYGKTKNTPVEERLFPVILPDFDDIRDAEELEDVIYHPCPQSVFDLMIPQYVVGFMFGVMVQAYASEHFARMTAMRSATTNAEEMIGKLSTQYNLVRQSAITNELAEIAGAAEILKGENLYEQYEQ